jgi:hypothetical protein
LQLSAQQAGVRLTVVDDGGLRSTELRAYAAGSTVVWPAQAALLH